MTINTPMLAGFVDDDHSSSFKQAQEGVLVAATACWETVQATEEENLRTLHRGSGEEEDIWKIIEAPAAHTGTPPRLIDAHADDRLTLALRRFDSGTKPAVIRSEEHDGVRDEGPSTRIFLIDPLDGTEPARALGFGSACVCLVFHVDNLGRRRFSGSAIATADCLLYYVVHKRTVIEARLLTPSRGVIEGAVHPTSSLDLSTSFDEVIPGDPKLMAVIGARPSHRALPAVAQLLSAENPAWIVGLGGTPLAARLVRGRLGSLIAVSSQHLRDAAHLPLVAGLEGGIVTDLSGTPLDVMALFETEELVPPSIAASSQESLEATLAVLAG